MMVEVIVLLHFIILILYYITIGDATIMANSKQNVKQMFQAAQAMRNSGKVITLDGSNKDRHTNGIPIAPQINNEMILQAFSMIDSHSRWLSNNLIIDNLNGVINVISTLIISQHNEWHVNEHHLTELIEDYLAMFMQPKNETDDATKEVNNHVKDYIVYSCLIYFAVYNKDTNRMKEYNEKIKEAVKAIIKYVRSQEASPSSTSSTNASPIVTPTTDTEVPRTDQ